MPSLKIEMNLEDEDEERIKKAGFTIQQFLAKAISDNLEKLKMPEPEVKQP